MVIFENARYGSRHEGLAKAHHIPDQHAAPLVEMVRGNLDGRSLKGKELLLEDCRNPKLSQAGARLLRQVVGR